LGGLGGAQAVAPCRRRCGCETAVRAASLSHAHAVEPRHKGIALPLIQRQLGHSHRSTTGTYLEGINTEEIISTVHARRAPMMHASAGLAP
jgi:site-specific recombinase XerD